MNEDYNISNESGKIYCGQPITPPPPPKSTIIIGDGYPKWCIDVDKKFNWLQKKMIKWCFGFEVKEYKDESKRNN
jgi:nitrous oxide reductase accessory protein NosL